jgi:hypothetical protein
MRLARPNPYHDGGGDAALPSGWQASTALPDFTAPAPAGAEQGSGASTRQFGKLIGYAAAFFLAARIAVAWALAPSNPPHPPKPEHPLAHPAKHALR